MATSQNPPFPFGATLEYLGSRTGSRIGHCPQGRIGPTYWQDPGTVCTVVETHEPGWSHEDDPACSVVEWPGGNKTIIWPDDADLWKVVTPTCEATKAE